MVAMRIISWTRRTREIGVLLALGSQRSGVARLIGSSSVNVCTYLGPNTFAGIEPESLT